MRYPLPSELDPGHYLKAELKRKQEALEKAHLDFAKSDEDIAALQKAWYDPKTRKRRVFPPEKIQTFKNEEARLWQAKRDLTAAVKTASLELHEVKKKFAEPYLMTKCTVV
jgi:hypothetical protein